MILLSSSRHVCFTESNLKAQKKLYSRFSQINFSWWKTENDLKRNINLCLKKFYPRSETSKSYNTVEEHSARILESWSQQLEFIAAFRIRRTFQIINVYKKWWGSLIENFTIQRSINEISRKRFYFTTCLVPFFEWNNERIPSEELNLLNELHRTREQARQESEYPMTIPTCEDPIDTDNSKCNCIRCQHVLDDGWAMFYESNCIKLWRKEHQDYKGQGIYVYKVYGHYNDITADDFFRVQIDTEYRKKWDSNSVKLEIIDSDRETNSDILYWEFQFPSMFYNRDYVCNRRFEINEEKKYIAIVSQSVEHPACPEKPPVHRVREYWSHTVIRPTNGSFTEPGVEFTITYFDNPELLVQSYISTWYTVTGMPEYIKKQRHAALNLALQRDRYEKAARDESRAAIVIKDPEWIAQEAQGSRKRVLFS